MLTSFRLASASVTTLLVTAASSFADPTVVALSGTAAPGSDTTYSSFNNASVNAAGQVAFTAGLANGTSSAGLFLGNPGAIQPVALQGQAAPGGGNYGTTFNAPSVNASGQLVFAASLAGGSSTSGIFTGTPGALQTVALQGTAAPGGGGNYAFTFNVNSLPTINSAGQVAFQSALSGGSSAAGLFTGTPGAVQAVALVGGAAPGGGTFANTFTSPVINSAGQLVAVSLIGTQVGLFTGKAGSPLSTVAFQGNPAPGTPNNYSSFVTNTYSINASGQISFTAGTRDVADTVGTGSAIFTSTNGTAQLIAANGGTAPGGAGNFNTFTGGLMNSSGKVAFNSALTGGTSTSGVFIGTPGSVQAIALQGTPAPTYGTNTTFSAFTSSPVVNGNGLVAFAAVVAGADVTTANDAALFVGAPGNVVTVVREGDLIDVDPGLGVDLRTVSGTIGILIGSGGADGKGSPFNDNGLLVYRLSFTDGSTGVFTSVVPEPAALSLLALAGTGLLRRRTSAR